MDSYRRGDLVFDVVDSGGQDGVPVVLLHGFPQSAACWRQVTPLLTAAGFRTLAPDQRGYSSGARPAGRRAYAVPELVADVVALLDAAGLEKAHVVGHDWGAAVAWATAVAHPERTATVTALSVPHPAALLRSLTSSTQLLHSWYVAAFQLPRLPELLFATRTGRRQVGGAMVRYGQSRERARADVERMSSPGAAAGPIGWYRGVWFGDRALVRGRVTVPALYVWSTRDAYLGRRAAELTGNWVDGPYRFEILEGASHWLPDERPADIAAMIVEHVRANGVS